MAAQGHFRALLRTPHLPVLFGSSFLARAPFAVVGVLLILRTREIGGSYAAGGAVVAAYSIAAAVASPPLARLIDRVGRSRVLAVGIPLHGCAFLAATLAPDSTPIWVLGVLGAVIGASYPQIGGMMRALISSSLSDPDRRHAAYGVESTGVELLFMLSPAIFVGGVAAHAGASAALGVAASVALAGSIVFGLSPLSRTAQAPPVEVSLAPAVGKPPPLITPAYGILILVILALGTTFGAIEVSATAFAEDHGHRTQVGFLMAVSAVGSAAGGIASIRAGAPKSAAQRITVLLALQAASTLLLAVPFTMAQMAVAMLLSGATIAPALTMAYGLTADCVPAARMTEGNAWVSTAMLLGSSAGVVIAGALATAGHVALAFVVTAIPVALAAAIVQSRRSLLSAPAGG